MEWKTRVTEMLGIKYPIIQGSYGGFGTSEIAAPVSEAGGLGIITAGALNTPEGLRKDIQKARSMTGKPIGVNLSIGMCPHVDEMREVAIEEGITVVETSVFKAVEHGKRLKEAGVKWIHKVATVRHALIAEQQGVDAVVIVDMEGTGFKSVEQFPTLIGISWAAKQIKIPIIAAGGISDLIFTIIYSPRGKLVLLYIADEGNTGKTNTGRASSKDSGCGERRFAKPDGKNNV